MHIVMSTDHLGLGGGCECIHQIARQLPDFTFTVSARGGSFPALEALPNVRIQADGGLPTEPFDLIHCHHLKALLRLRGRQTVPVLHTVHGIHVRQYEYQDGCAARFKYFCRQRLEGFLYRRTAASIVLTEDDRRWLARHYRLSNMVLIPNGVPATAACSAAERRALAAELQLPPAAGVLMMIARVDAFFKGYDILLEALRQAAGFLRDSGRQVVLIGSGRDLEECRRKSCGYRLDDIVHFAGAIPEAKRFLPLAEALLLPSRWEGLPLIALEAGMCGIPVIGSDAPGVGSLFESGRTGWVFPSGDDVALATLLTRPETYEKLPELGRNWQQEVRQHYTVERMAGRLRRLYETVSQTGKLPDNHGENIP